MTGRRTNGTRTRKCLLIIFLPNESFERSIHLVNIQGNCRLGVARVVDPIRCGIAAALHALELLSEVKTRWYWAWMTDGDLFIGPAVHAQRFDFGYVGTEFAMKRGTPHTQEDTQLRNVSAMDFEGVMPKCNGRCYLRSSWPILESCQLIAVERGLYDAPGLRAPQSAHLSFPGTVLTSSCRALSLRTWVRLLIVVVISF